MQQRQADGGIKDERIDRLCVRVLRIGALACLPLLGACAGQFGGVDAEHLRASTCRNRVTGARRPFPSARHGASGTPRRAR